MVAPAYKNPFDTQPGSEVSTPGPSRRPSMEEKREFIPSSLKDSAEPEALAAVPTLLNEEPLVVLPLMSKTRRIILGAVMMLTYFLASSTSNAMVMMIPSMSSNLKVPELAVQWICSAYTLANGCGLLVSGRLADLYGRKQLYLGGLGLYCVLSLVSGFIRSQIALAVLRAFTGLGTAISMPAAFGIVGVGFPVEPERTVAFSVLALGYPIGAMFGQIIGGIMASTGPHGWQYLFWLLAGFSLIPIVVGFMVIPNESAKRAVLDRRIDWIGACIITIAIALFTFAITQSGLVPQGWKTPYIPIVFVISILLIVAFGVYEHYLETKTTFPPIMNISILTRYDYKVSFVLLISFSVYVAIAGWVYLTTIWYQNYKGYSALKNALYVLTAPIVGCFAGGIIPVLAPRVRAPVMLLIGCVSTSLCNLLYAVEPAGTIYWAAEFPANMLNPFGADFTVGIGSILISNLVSESEQSVAGALFQTALQLSSTVGVCMASLISTEVSNSTDSLLAGLRDAFWVNAGWAWLGAVLTVATLWKVGLAKDVGQLVKKA